MGERDRDRERQTDRETKRMIREGGGLERQNNVKVCLFSKGL